MIESFKHKALKELFLKGKSKGINATLQSRCILRLDALDSATRPDDMNIPGFNFHGLRGKPKRYSVHVSGNWCITFEWDLNSPVRVDLEDYH